MQDQAVTDVIQGLDAPWKIEACEALRAAIHDAVPDVTERIQYKKPHFLKNGSYLAVISPAKGWVSFAIFNATDLEAPTGFFEKGPPERKTVRITEGQKADYAFIGDLVKQAANSMNQPT
jgi:hypothetical protein